MDHTISLTILIAALLSSPEAAADAPELEPPSHGAVLHAPPARWVEDEEHYRLVADATGRWTADRLEAQVRRPGTIAWTTVPFRRQPRGDLTAAIPAALVRAPGVEYYLRSMDPDGSARPRFATDTHPHTVAVEASKAGRMERMLLARHGGNRVNLAANFHHVNLGSAPSSHAMLASIPHKDRSYADWYHLLEVDSTYRFLLPGIYHIKFGFGMLGGHLGQANPDRSAWEALSPDLRWSGAPTMPGLYYGYTSVYWEIAGWVGFEPRVIMGASHRGFEGGGGLLMRLGPLSRTHFDVAFEGISHVGWRFHTELAWDTVPYVEMSLRTEITNYPMNGDRATIPTFNFKVDLDPVRIHGSIGYGLRKGYAQGGVTFGGGISAVF